MKWISKMPVAFSLLLLTGCAVRFYDAKDGVVHLYGLAHLKMRALPQIDEQPSCTNVPAAYATGVGVVGLRVDAGSDFVGLAVGFSSGAHVVFKQPDATWTEPLWPTNVSPVLRWVRKSLAIAYEDAETRTRHLWGFGHLRMQVQATTKDGASHTNAEMSRVNRSSTLGFSLGGGEGRGGIAAGWDVHSRVNILTEDSSFYLHWPTNTTPRQRHARDPFVAQAGTDFPLDKPLQTNQSQKTP